MLSMDVPQGNPLTTDNYSMRRHGSIEKGMKKDMKKILALVLAMMLVFAGVAALAEDPAGRTIGGNGDATPLTNRTITLTNPSAGHTYTLYQIFTGTYKLIDSKDTLGDVRWGNGIKDAGQTDLYTHYNLTGSNQTAAKVAEAITDTEAGARAFANAIADTNLQNGVEKTAATGANPASLVWDNLSEGYYIIKDTTATLPEGDERDLVVVQVLDNVTITAKSGTVVFDKKVKDHDDSTQKPTVYDEAGHVSDYDIGDEVPYEVTITLPSNFTSYEYYSMTVRDKMGDGLSFNPSSVAVKIGTTEVPSTAYSVIVKGSEPTGVEELPDTETFEIRFADVKSIAGAGNNVTFTVTYTATLTGDNVVYGKPGNPNEAWLTYSNNPVTGQEGGSTPHKTTLTFVYKFEADKVDPDGNALAGATFELYKSEMAEDGTTSWVKKTLVKSQAGTEFTIAGLDAGWYELVETEAPAGYNSIDPIYFVIEHTYNTAKTDIETLTATKTDENGTKLTGEGSALSANLEHVAATAEHEEIEAGEVITDVVNNKGVELPSTGGMGTTILYIGGSILVILAAVLLITKRRMNAND